MNFKKRTTYIIYWEAHFLKKMEHYQNTLEQGNCSLNLHTLKKGMQHISLSQCAGFDWGRVNFLHSR